MSLAGPIVSPDGLSGQTGRVTPPPGRDGFADIQLSDGWAARVVVGHALLGSGYGGLNGSLLTSAHWREWLRQPLRWIEKADQRDLIKTSSTTTVCRIRLPLGDGRHIEAVYKRGKSRHFRKRLLALFRTSRPMRTWRRAQTLLRARIPTARPLAILERRRFGMLLDSLIITEFLPRAVDLEGLLTVGMRDMPPIQARRLKRQLAAALTDFVLCFQRAGLCHRDFKALNVLVQWDPKSPEPPRISMVDLDGVKPARFYGKDAWMRMLMRLNVSVDSFRKVSLTDRLRVLKCFLDQAGATGRQGASPASWKEAWRRLAVMSDRKREIRDRQQERSFRKYGRY